MMKLYKHIALAVWLAASTAFAEAILDTYIPSGESLQSPGTWGPSYQMIRDRSYMSNEGVRQGKYHGNRAQTYFGMGQSKDSLLPSTWLPYYLNVYAANSPAIGNAFYRYNGGYGGIDEPGTQTNNVDTASPYYWPTQNVPLGWLARESRTAVINILADQRISTWLDYEDLRNFTLTPIDPLERVDMGTRNAPLFRNATNLPPITTNYYGTGSYTLPPGSEASALRHVPSPDDLAGYWTSVHSDGVLYARPGFEIRDENYNTGGAPNAGAGVYTTESPYVAELRFVDGGSYAGLYYSENALSAPLAGALLHVSGAAVIFSDYSDKYITDFFNARLTAGAVPEMVLPERNYGYAVVMVVAESPNPLGDGLGGFRDALTGLYVSDSGSGEDIDLYYKNATQPQHRFARHDGTAGGLQLYTGQVYGYVDFENAGDLYGGSWQRDTGHDSYHVLSDSAGNFVIWAVRPRGYYRQGGTDGNDGGSGTAGYYEAHAGVPAGGATVTYNRVDDPLMVIDGAFSDYYIGNENLGIAGTLRIETRIEYSRDPDEYLIRANIASGDLLGPWLIQDNAEALEHARAVQYAHDGNDGPAYTASPAFHSWLQFSREKHVGGTGEDDDILLGSYAKIGCIVTHSGTVLDKVWADAANSGGELDAGARITALEYGLGSWSGTGAYNLWAIVSSSNRFVFSVEPWYTGGGANRGYYAYLFSPPTSEATGRFIYDDVALHISPSRVWLGTISDSYPSRVCHLRLGADDYTMIERYDGGGFDASDYKLRYEPGAVPAARWTVRKTTFTDDVVVANASGTALPNAAGVYRGSFDPELPAQSMPRTDNLYTIATLATNESSSSIGADTAFIRPVSGAVSIDHGIVGGTYAYNGSNFVHSSLNYVIREVPLFSGTYQQVNPPDMAAPVITPTSGSFTNASGPMTDITISGTYPYMPDGPLYSAPYLTVEVAGYATRVFGITDVGGTFTIEIAVPVSTNESGTAVSAKLSRLASWPASWWMTITVLHGTASTETLYNTSAVVAAPDAATAPGTPTASVIAALSNYTHNRVQLSLGNYNELAVYEYGDWIGRVPAGTLLPVMYHDYESGVTATAPVNQGWTNAVSGSPIDLVGLVSSNTSVVTSGLQVTLEPGVYVKTTTGPAQNLYLVAHHAGPVSYTRNAGPAGPDDPKVIGTLYGYSIIPASFFGQTNPVSLSLAAWVGPYTAAGGGTNTFYIPATEIIGDGVVSKNIAALADQVYPEVYAGSGFYVFTNANSRVDAFDESSEVVVTSPLFFVNADAGRLAGMYTGVGAATGTLEVEEPPYWYLEEPGFDGTYTASSETLDPLGELTIHGIDFSRAGTATLLDGVSYTIPANDINDTDGLTVTLENVGLFQDRPEFDTQADFDPVSFEPGTPVRKAGNAVRYVDSLVSDSIWRLDGPEIKDALIVHSNAWAGTGGWDSGESFHNYINRAPPTRELQYDVYNATSGPDLLPDEDPPGYYTTYYRVLRIAESAYMPGNIRIVRHSVSSRHGVEWPIGYVILADGRVVAPHTVQAEMEAALPDMDKSLVDTDWRPSWGWPWVYWANPGTGVGITTESRTGTNNVDSVAADFMINWRAPK